MTGGMGAGIGRGPLSTGRGRRIRQIALATVLAVGMLVGLLACSGDPDEPWVPPSPSGSVAAACEQVMAALPATVAGQSMSEPSGRWWRSWGDPAITLRCGVGAPADLEPTSRCDVVNDVGWFSVERRESYRFTTIGRLGFVEVTVPHQYAPEADALVDLSRAVSAMPEVSPCQ